jgi:hypothetical protein
MQAMKWADAHVYAAGGFNPRAGCDMIANKHFPMRAK